MRIGALEVEIVSGGRFRLDGGGMFGIIPRPLWSRSYPPDDRGRIPLDTNCLLVRAGGELILVDTGNGSKLDERERQIFDLPAGDPLAASLAARGVRPADITIVVFTHLHMDHAGGATRLEDGAVVPSFPRARFLVQRREWLDARRNRSHMRTSYRRENLEPLRASGRLELLEGDAAIAPGVEVRVTPGHTRGHQSVLLRGGGEAALYAGDLCPTAGHMRSTYNMAYDIDPYRTVRMKARMLRQAADEGWLWIFDHEPERRVVRVARQGEQFVPVDP